MDKNTLFGFLLIIAILVGYSWYSQPSKEEIELQRAQQDSIRLAQAQEQAIIEAESILKTEVVSNDSVNNIINPEQFGVFSTFVTGTAANYVLENNKLKVAISNKGAYVSNVEVKNYTTYEGKPLVLFDSSEVKSNITFVTSNNRIVESKNLFFKLKSRNDSSIVLELAIGIGKALRITYTLPEDSYMMHYDIHAYNLENELSTREIGLDMEWGMKIKQQERGRKFENRYSGLYFKYLEDDVENLNNEKSEHQSLTNRVKWIAYKDQFFSSVLISDSYFSSTDVSSELLKEPYLKECITRMLIPFDPRGDESTHMRFFFGPNQYKILKGFDKGVDSDKRLNLDSLLPLGWAIFGWVNKYMVIPVFDFLGGFMTNYGLIILLLTIIIKIVLLPFTFKSYMSTAKMRVLRPQIDEINAKIPSDKAMERQQATMALYKRAGVSPMGGCLPMLLQMPILYAMFTFFPSSIELRQKAFLWADDLSTFDSILSWDTYIPIISSIYGNHVSLFCLLMCVTNIFYTYINMKDQPTNQQMPMMKWMMYLMPIMFLFIFNDYAAGLSYYYLLSLLITIGQTFLFRLFVKDEKVLAKLNENKKKPQKKSKFMDRLEQMQKQQLEMQKQKTQQGNKRR